MEYFFWACLLGAISAVSLPLGSWIGLRWTFSSNVLSILAAFGAGALLAALSVELVAPTALALSHGGAEESATAVEEFVALVIGCLGGGVAYLWLDKAVNSRGGFARKASTMIRYNRKKDARTKRTLLRTLSSMPYFKGFPVEHVDEFLPDLVTITFRNGEVISREGTAADDVYLILEGTVSAGRENNEFAEYLAGTFSTGLVPLLAGGMHLATSVAKGDVKALRIKRATFHKLRKLAPEFDALCRKAAVERLESYEQAVEAHTEKVRDWATRAMNSLSEAVALPEIPEEKHLEEKHHRGAPFAVWLGILLDGIPESLVLGAGMLWALKPLLEAGATVSFHQVIPFTLIAGLFLSNLPEALSSSANMLQQGLKKRPIFLMWFSLMLITALGAGLGYLISGQLTPAWTVFFQGLAAGAMLTMIVSAMIPEAVLLGSGNVAGISTLAGFLAAIVFKLLE